MTGDDAAAITVVGSINMDLVVGVAALPVPGQTLLGRTFTTICGGKGSNQAIAAARAGATVAMVGAVGDDAFGAVLADNLAGNGVDVGLLRRVPGASGIAAIAVDDAAENTIVVVPGANGVMLELSEAEVHAITNSLLTIAQLELPIETVTAAATAAAAAGRSFLLNPSPVRSLSDALLAATTILVLNEGEAAALGHAAVARVPHVVTTLGAAGAKYRGPAESFTVAAPKVAAVDTTGAGDAFTGAFAVAWVQGRSPREAVQRGCAAGALAATVRGAGVSAPRRAAIDALVDATYGA